MEIKQSHQRAHVIEQGDLPEGDACTTHRLIERLHAVQVEPVHVQHHVDWFPTDVLSDLAQSLFEQHRTEKGQISIES